MYYFPFQIAPAGSLPQTSLPLTAAQLQQLQTGAIMQLNQKVFIILLFQIFQLYVIMLLRMKFKFFTVIETKVVANYVF